MNLDFREFLLTEGYKKPSIKDMPVVCTVAIFRKNGSKWEILLEKRQKEPTEHEWALPGGHIDEKDGKLESYSEAAIREVLEETGLKINPQQLIFVQEKRREGGKVKDDVLFATVISMEESKRAKAGSDADEIVWRSIDRIPQLNFDHNLFVEEALRKVLEQPNSKKVSLKKIHSPVKTNRGFLIVFEGVDGAGKTSQIELLANKLTKEGYSVKQTRWASSDLLQKAIKKSKQDPTMTPTLYSLLHAADMSRRYTTNILPWLAQNHVVICDRYIYTSYARDIARGVDPSLLNEAYVNFRKPDVLLHCSSPLNVTLDRLKSEKGLSYYGSGQDLHLHSDDDLNCTAYQKIMHGLYTQILPQVDTYKRIDTNRPIKEVQKSVIKAVMPKLEDWSKKESKEPN